MRYFFLLLTALYLYGCSHVVSTTHLPKDNKPLSTFPEIIEGDFFVKADMLEQRHQSFSKRYWTFKLESPHSCRAHSYDVFTLADFNAKADTYAYKIKGDSLYYHDDSLFQIVTELEVKQDKGGGLTKAEKRRLMRLKNSGKVDQVFALTKRGEEYIFNRQLLLEMDLKQRSFVYHTDQGGQERSQLMLKQQGDRYCMNLQGVRKSSGWLNLIVSFQAEQIEISTINFKNLQDHLAQYEAQMPVESLKPYLFRIAPSSEYWEQLTQEANFFKSIISLERQAPISASPSNLPMWIIAGMAVLSLLVLGWFFLQKTSK